jgi:hypothetical protein
MPFVTTFSLLLLLCCPQGNKSVIDLFSPVCAIVRHPYGISTLNSARSRSSRNVHSDIKLSDRESIKFLPIARDEMPEQNEITDWVKRYEQEVKPDQPLLINVITAGLRQK